MCNHSYGCNPTTERMQIFFDTGAKFHEFPLWCGIAERIGWKPSSYAPYKNPAFEALSLSIIKHLCFWECKARISRCIVIFACTIYVLWFVGGWRGIFHFFFSSSSASDSKEFAMEITSVNPDFLGESNHIQLCKNNIKLSAAVGLVKCKV